MTRRFFSGDRLTAADWRLLAGACAVQTLTALALRAVSLTAVRAAMARLAPIIKVLLPGTDARVVWAVVATGRRMRGISTCLVRALVVEGCLSSPERPLRVTIGVKRVMSGSLHSHAWVDDRGRILIGGPVDVDLLPIVVWERAA